MLFCFDCASRCNRLKKNQLDAQLILSILRRLLHVSGVSTPIIRRYNRMYTTIGTYYSFSMKNKLCIKLDKSNTRWFKYDRD